MTIIKGYQLKNNTIKGKRQRGIIMFNQKN